jgi:hypothetical protein
MKKLVWVEEAHMDKIRELDPEAKPAELVPIDSNAVIITYLGRSLTPEQFVKVSRKYKQELEDSISALEQHSKRKFELILAQDDNHIRKSDAGFMAKLGWFRASK